jgi:hypothetical protein
MSKEKTKKPRKKPNPQLSFSLASTSGKIIKVSSPKVLDKSRSTGYTGITMTTGKYPQQLKHPDEKLWREIKAAAVMAGKTMTQWVEEACRKQLAPISKPKKAGVEKPE